MCPWCEKHGVIIFSDKTLSEDLACQEDAEKAIRKGLAEEKLLSSEVPSLMQQVRDYLAVEPEKIPDEIMMAIAKEVMRDEDEEGGGNKPPNYGPFRRTQKKKTHPICYN